MRWNKIESVLDVVLEAEPDKWSTLAKETCGDDEKLLREVEELLGRAPKIKNFLQTSDMESLFSSGAIEAFSGEKDQTEEFQQIGRYRIIREIAHGGMGRVFLAERADGSYEQQVALKLLHSSLDTETMRRRFRTERQILASLRHPNISRLLDGGMVHADSGQGEHRPYLVMEYLEGQTIREYCEAEDLSVDDRLKLFLNVAGAIQHAHHNLVVHCDIKPSNILVTKEKEVKLLDFGIARLLDEGVPEMSESYDADEQLATLTGHRWLTPEYAAPEQIKGERVTTATDVYQLGVVLYELLTGRRPFQREGNNIRQLEQIILREEPVKPSMATEQSHLRKMFQGDLDAIVQKTLQKEPEARYSSTEDLIEDIQRYISGQPVLARSGSIGYRAGKFIRRNRWGVSAAVLVAVSILTGLGIALWQAHVAGVERDQAQLERGKAEEVIRYFTGLFEANDPNVAQGDIITVREVLERGIQHAEALESQPRLQATLFGVTGKVYYNLGNNGQAEALYRRALAIWETMEPGAENEEERVQALLGLGHTIVKEDRYAEAEQLYRRVIELRSPMGISDKHYQNGLFGLYATFHSMGRMEEANEAFEKWETTLVQTTSAPDAETADRMVTLGRNLGYRGQIRGEVESFRRGKALLNRALPVLRSERGPQHPSVGHALNRMSTLLIQELSLQPNDRLLSVADSVTREAVALHRKVYKEQHSEVKESFFNRSRILRNLKLYDEAEDLIHEAMVIVESTEGKEQTDWYRGLSHLAGINYSRESFDEAAAQYRQVRDWRARTFGDEDLYTLLAELDITPALIGAGRFQEAENQLLQTYGTLDRLRGLDDRFTQASLRQLIALYEAWNKPEVTTEYRAQLVEVEPNGVVH